MGVVLWYCGSVYSVYMYIHTATGGPYHWGGGPPGTDTYIYIYVQYVYSNTVKHIHGIRIM